MRDQDDELFWELLEEQHNHDVVMHESQKGGTDVEPESAVKE